MSNEQIKKAFGDAEKELQQEEIDKIKGIVRSYLEEIQEKQDKKNRKQKEVDEIDEEIRLLKKDLDDLKAGRLDKMEERQRIDKRAREISIIIIKKVEKEYIPYRPWYSPYEITWNNHYPQSDPNKYYCLNGTCGQTTGTYPLNQPATSLTYSSVGATPAIYTVQSGINDFSAINTMMSSAMDSAMKVTGSLMQNFVGGSYNINDQIINL